MSNCISWETWNAYWNGCTACPIGTWSHMHVLGGGPRTAKVLMIGEGPGRSEDVLGTPFVGRAGKLLNEMLVDAGTSRDCVFVTNLVACRPSDDPTAPNRAPTEQEITNCEPRLEQLLKLLRPRAVVLIGRVAQLFGNPLLQRLGWQGFTLFLIHPAALLRQGGKHAPGYPAAVDALAAFCRKVPCNG